MKTVESFIREDDREKLEQWTASRLALLDHVNLKEARRLMAQLPVPFPQTGFSIDSGLVGLGNAASSDNALRQKVVQTARAMMPWKKGPYCLMGETLDAEWRCDLKWDRLAAALPNQRGATILDVGCCNGYFMFRLAQQQPQLVLGIDPVARLYLQFQLLQRLSGLEQLHMRMWGWEQLTHLKAAFDTVFSMGIFYHHSNPIGMIRALQGVMKPGGLLVLESIVIPGDGPLCYLPSTRYAKMRNVWFIPTVDALVASLNRCHFRDIKVVAVNQHGPQEQRSTDWHPGPSHTDFMDPDDQTRTIEGHPAPLRAIVFARQK